MYFIKIFNKMIDFKIILLYNIYDKIKRKENYENKRSFTVA